jgi:hypothetical protein
MYGGGAATFQDYLTGLQNEESQGAPVRNLITAEQQLSQGAGNIENWTFTTFPTALNDQLNELGIAAADAKAINRACGLPPSWNANKLDVPAGG